jgi:hypothetical protein
MTNAFDEMDLRAMDEAWQRKQERKAEDSSSEGKKAADWLADFAEKSEEALGKRAAEKELAPPPDEKALVEALAAIDHTEYDRVRRDVAKTLGIRVGTLDDKVAAVRKKRAKPAPSAPVIDATKAAATAGDLVTDPDILTRFGSQRLKRLGRMSATEFVSMYFAGTRASKTVSRLRWSRGGSLRLQAYAASIFVRISTSIINLLIGTAGWTRTTDLLVHSQAL